ncbi:MAG: DUF2178 domain-containing protein [Candidatus Aenigmatarchaeota archaeon]
MSDSSNESKMRKVYMGLWGLSGVSLASLIVAGYPLAGAGAFVLFGLAAMVSFRRYDGPLFDERDERRQEKASKRTLGIMGLTSAIVFPGTTALWGLDIIEWPVWLSPIAFFVAGLTFVHVGSMMYEARRQE